jgi:pimeloyl-ACP methyl ester carboxylesterase
MITEKSTRPRRRRFLISLVPVLVIALFTVGAGGSGAAPKPQAAQTAGPTIVLVHGDWADASSWNAVIRRLQDRGFTVVAPPNLLRGVSQDAPYLASYLQTIPGPIVLVGHSYGGFVITNAATGNPNVKALVYIDAVVPDEGETLGGLAAGTTSCVIVDGAFNQVPIAGGVDLYLNFEPNPPYAGFLGCFANGVDEQTARLLAATQRPAAAAQFSDPSGAPAWRTIPSWALLGRLDNVIPPDLQQTMYKRAGARISRVNAGHLSLITRPDAVVRVILSAVEATT